jgi:transposase InsO family protein
MLRVFSENFSFYGARKVWRQMKREVFEIARCMVERLMGDLGLQSVIRGKPVKTTIRDKAAHWPLDQVNRQFHASVQNMLSVSGGAAVQRTLHLRRNLGRVRLCRLCDRCLRPLHRGLAGERDGACQLRGGCPRKGDP